MWGAANPAHQSANPTHQSDSVDGDHKVEVGLQPSMVRR